MKNPPKDIFRGIFVNSAGAEPIFSISCKSACSIFLKNSVTSKLLLLA